MPPRAPLLPLSSHWSEGGRSRTRRLAFSKYTHSWMPLSTVLTPLSTRIGPHAPKRTLPHVHCHMVILNHNTTRRAKNPFPDPCPPSNLNDLTQRTLGSSVSPPLTQSKKLLPLQRTRFSLLPRAFIGSRSLVPLLTTPPSIFPSIQASPTPTHSVQRTPPPLQQRVARKACRASHIPALISATLSSAPPSSATRSRGVHSAAATAGGGLSCSRVGPAAAVGASCSSSW